ncbi:optineurin [Arapaima gigas]
MTSSKSVSHMKKRLKCQICQASKRMSSFHMPKTDPTESRPECEELTVSWLLRSLRRETEKGEKLELELQAAKRSQSLQEVPPRADQFPTEVDSLAVRMRTLREVQSVQSKLEDAEDTKRNLHDKELEDWFQLQAQLVEKQKVEDENTGLKLKLVEKQQETETEATADRKALCCRRG